MFEVGGQYANRIGRYKVLDINEPTMTVQYDDGSTAELRITIQERIWENILAEEEIEHSRSSRSRGQRAAKGSKYFIRPINSLVAEQLAVRGYKEHVLVSDIANLRISRGDRLIYYAVESQVYFAVATITGVPSEPTARDLLTDKQADETVLLFPVDVDARAVSVETAVSRDAIEIESQLDIKQLLTDLDIYISITEDEFELLAELLTEATEEAADEEEDKADDDEEDFED